MNGPPDRLETLGPPAAEPPRSPRNGKAPSTEGEARSYFFITGNQLLRESDQHAAEAKEANAMLEDFRTSHPTQAAMDSAEKVRHLGLVATLVLPLFADYLLVFPTMQELLRANLQLTGRAATSIATLMGASLLAGGIFALSVFGSGLKGHPGAVLRGCGLLLATTVPVGVLSNTLAQADIAGQSWGLALRDHMHVLGLTFLSASIHALVSVMAPEILQSIGAVMGIRFMKQSSQRQAKATHLSRARETEAFASVNRELMKLRAIERRSQVRYTFERNDPRIIDYINYVNQAHAA